MTRKKASQALAGGLAAFLALVAAGEARAASTLTLPATTTAYSAGQLIASSATAGSVANPSFTLTNQLSNGSAIPRLRLSTNDTTSTAWGAQTVQVDLWLGSVAIPAGVTWTNGDRGAWSPATGTGNHLGSYTCSMSAEFGDGAYAECSPNVGTAAFVKVPSNTPIYWSLDAITGSGVTGASKVFTLTPEIAN